jgi:hypothetical protein
VETTQEAPEIELRPIEHKTTNVPQEAKHEVPDPDHKPPVTELKPRQVETLKEFPLPERWSPYFAGDRVEAIRLQVSTNSQTLINHFPIVVQI